MNPLFTFILGLLIGWLIEWLIDFSYWRRRYAEKGTAYVPDPPSASRATSIGEVEGWSAESPLNDASYFLEPIP
jgi:hypothetical protein